MEERARAGAGEGKAGKTDRTGKETQVPLLLNALCGFDEMLQGCCLILALALKHLDYFGCASRRASVAARQGAPPCLVAFARASWRCKRLTGFIGSSRADEPLQRRCIPPTQAQRNCNPTQACKHSGKQADCRDTFLPGAERRTLPPKRPAMRG